MGQEIGLLEEIAHDERGVVLVAAEHAPALGEYPPEQRLADRRQIDDVDGSARMPREPLDDRVDAVFAAGLHARQCSRSQATSVEALRFGPEAARGAYQAVAEATAARPASGALSRNWLMAITPTIDTAVRYQAMAMGSPVTSSSQVTTSCVVPPNTATGIE
jgi:hypothetical protein